MKLTPLKYGLVWATKLRMKYDALGNRVVKENPKRKQKEIYIRDAQGNILALYQVKNDSLYAKEFYMYGSQRLGYFEDEVFLGRKCISKWCNVLTPVLPMFSSTLSNSVGVVFGKKRYELSDWLGNVRVVINDRKTPINSGNTTVGYKAQVVSVSDYYSFGSEINERTYTYNTPYRFSFNGKEDIRDQRWYQDYGARWYNKVLGRFISPDPLIVGEKKYAWLSSYQFASNTPIQAKDIDGLEAFFVHGTWSNPSTWSKETITEVKTAVGNKTDVLFQWSGYNIHAARYEAAIKLVNEIYRKRNPDEPLTLIGHSHGGNVAIIAANMLSKMGVKVDKLITINTPVRPEYQLREGAVGVHYNVYTESDLVQVSGGNNFNIPDELETVYEGYEKFIIPKSHEGKYKLTGEIGRAGRTFKEAINIKYDDDFKELGHKGHHPEQIKKWIPKVEENEPKDNKK